MELNTWTRKSNAEAAVKKALAKMDLHEDILITGVEAADVGFGNKSAFAVKVFVEIEEGATIARDEFACFVRTMTPMADVVLNHDEWSSSEEKEPVDLEQLGERGPKIKRRASSGRNSPYRGSKIFVSGGNDATNPFRPKSKSHAAFDFVQTNPGTKFEDLQSFGVRIRTITECLRKGTMRSTTK